MKTLKFAPHLVPLVLSGEKTSTWRLFDDKDLQESDELMLINKETGEEFARATILNTREKKLKDLEEADFEGHEKFESVEKMYETYKSYYGDRVGPDTIVKIINFKMNIMKIILVDAVNTFVVDGQINQEMFKLLETYSNKKIILTNANDEQLVTFGLVNLPYDIFTLKHNPDKVDPKYFELMLDGLKLNREDVVYFEHNPDAVKSAESVGIKSYLYYPQEKDLDKLKQFLDTNI